MAPLLAVGARPAPVLLQEHHHVPPRVGEVLRVQRPQQQVGGHPVVEPARPAPRRTPRRRRRRARSPRAPARSRRRGYRDAHDRRRGPARVPDCGRGRAAGPGPAAATAAAPANAVHSSSTALMPAASSAECSIGPSWNATFATTIHSSGRRFDRRIDPPPQPIHESHGAQSTRSGRTARCAATGRGTASANLRRRGCRCVSSAAQVGDVTRTRDVEATDPLRPHRRFAEMPVRPLRTVRCGCPPPPRCVGSDPNHGAGISGHSMTSIELAGWSDRCGWVEKMSTAASCDAASTMA